MPLTLAPTLTLIFCTRDGTRTRTAVKPRDFKSLVSTIPPPRHRNIEFRRANVGILGKLWPLLKKRPKDEENETVMNCNALKMDYKRIQEIAYQKIHFVLINKYKMYIFACTFET
jgi:hypothetical protein